MAEPFLAEVKIVGFNFPPRGWAFCDGQILPINQNQALFSLMGTTFGGDGQSTFGLPELRGRVTMHVDPSNSAFRWGQKGGEETHPLSLAEMPSHAHGTRASSGADTDDPAGAFGGLTEDATYHTASGATLVNMGSSTVAAGGGGQGHQNMQPFLAVNYCIALTGVFPSWN